MPTDHNQPPAAAPAALAEVSLTWTVTDTFIAKVALRDVADAVGQTAQALAADPDSLRGAAHPALVRLLTDRQDEDTLLDTAGEVEITGAEIAEQPSLADLVDAAWRVLQAESDADQHTSAGRALAALLAGLRREEVIDP